MKRRVSMKDVDLHTIVKKYVSLKYPECQLDGLSLYITALISPKPTADTKDLSGLINMTLYKFNKH